MLLDLRAGWVYKNNHSTMQWVRGPTGKTRNTESTGLYWKFLHQFRWQAPQAEHTGRSDLGRLSRGGWNPERRRFTVNWRRLQGRCQQRDESTQGETPALCTDSDPSKAVNVCDELSGFTFTAATGSTWKPKLTNTNTVAEKSTEMELKQNLFVV